MDTTTIIVIAVLTALALGAIVWMDLHSRRKAAEGQDPDYVKRGTELASRDSCSAE